MTLGEATVKTIVDEIPLQTGISAEQQLGQKLLEERLITAKQLFEALERQKIKGGRLGDNIIDLGFMTAEVLNSFFNKKPLVPKTIEDTGLDASFLVDLVMKHILFMGEFRLADLSDRIKLPVSIVDSLLEMLQREKFIEIKGATEYARFSYKFAITGLGQKRAAELLEICRYVGPAPVPLDLYRKMVTAQTIKNISIRPETITKAFSHLVINDKILKKMGPAITSGRAMFMYGPPGNGKTSIAETIGKALPQTVYIPFSIFVGGEIISLFDPVNHVPVNTENGDETEDKRWVLIKRPVIMAGGELTLKTMDLEFNPISKFYIAPLQMKANNGLFIIDDFGRQQIEPKKLLNRWIVPLERRIDFMTLHTGMKFEIPFDQLVVFCTNLAPKDLVDEAFLRRIRYKINIDHPSEREFEVIFKRVCEANGIEFDSNVFDYLMDNFYKKLDIKPSACQPRDIIDQIIDNARYYRHPPKLTNQGITDAWENYFVEL
jgi:hypothetical protein